MRQGLLLILLCGVAFSLRAQNTKVYNINSLKPVQNVYILEKKNQRSAFSNEEGEIDLKLFEKTDTVLIQHPGFLPEVKTIGEILDANKTIYLREKTVDLLEFVVTSNKRVQKKTEVSNQVSRLNAQDVELFSPQTSADLLEYNGDVFVQKSQLGGGSPMIRGFSANKVLIVVDGVRMNNAIFRGGNLQNVINVDPLSLASTEVVYGPSSLIYGSDALGGVMSFTTKKAAFGKKDTANVKANAFARYSSANSERNVHIDLNFGGERFASFSSVSASQFGDLRAGKNRPKAYGDFGLRKWRVSSSSGFDTLVENTDTSLMIPSAYGQLNLMQKFSIKLSDNALLNYGLIFSTTTDIPRYDRLIQTRNGQPRSAEWYYGPQSWLMNNLSLSLKQKSFFYDKMNVTAAWQRFSESRSDRPFKSEWLRTREELVDVYTLNVDFDKKLGDQSTFYFGIEGSFNQVSSSAERRNIFDGTQEASSTRYPSAGSQVYQTSFYSLYQRKWSNKLTGNIGLRYTYYQLESDLSDTSFFSFPYNQIRLQTSALTGNAGLVYTPNKLWQISSNISSGFRAPNLDDVAKVFDSEPGRVLVPNPELQPEYAYTGEITVIRTFGKNSKIQLNSFYTYALNAIVRGPFQFDGQDSILYDGEQSEVLSLVNSNAAIIYGLSSQAEIFFTRQLGIKGSLTWIDGEDRENMESLRHVPPVFGSSNVFFRKENFFAQMGVNFNGAIAYEDLAPSEQTKTHLYTPDGSLAWWTLNAKVSYEMKTFAVQAGCDNVLDSFYWTYSSGIAAPGRNIYVALKFKI